MHFVSEEMTQSCFVVSRPEHGLLQPVVHGEDESLLLFDQTSAASALAGRQPSPDQLLPAAETEPGPQRSHYRPHAGESEPAGRGYNRLNYFSTNEKRKYCTNVKSSL